MEKTFTRQGIPYELSVKRTLREIPVLNWLIKVLRFSVSPEDEQTGIGVLCDGRYGEKYTRKKAQKIIREQIHGAAPLYDRMAGFRDWADSTAGINADTELPSEIWEYLKSSGSPASYICGLRRRGTACNRVPQADVWRNLYGI